MINVRPSVSTRRAVGDVLVQKLSGARPLSVEARRALRTMPCSLHRHRRQNVIVEAGRPVEHLTMLLDGYAARMKVTRWGEQPIVGTLLPGDVFDWPLLSLRAAGGPTQNIRLDHSVCAVTNVVVAVFRLPTLLSLLEEWPEVRHALDAAAGVERNITHEWLANLAGRPAPERLAHLLCEHYHRMRTLGFADDGSCPLPFSQARLAAALGLSVVHTNRLLRRLSEDGLLRAHARRLTVLDLGRLEAFADFSADYLTCLGRAPAPALRRRGVSVAES